MKSRKREIAESLRILFKQAALTHPDAKLFVGPYSATMQELANMEEYPRWVWMWANTGVPYRYLHNVVKGLLTGVHNLSGSFVCS